MGLQARLLAGLAVLVFAAIGSAGWLTVRVARAGLEAEEEDRARGMGDAAAALLAQAGDEAQVVAAAKALAGLGGLAEVTVVDVNGRALVGAVGNDGAVAVARRGGATFTQRSGDLLTVYAPVRPAVLPSGARPVAARVAAVRLRVAVGSNLEEAVGGSTRLLVAVTLFDGSVILIFGWLFVRSVVRPLAAVSRAAQRVAEGELEGPPVEGGDGETRALADSFNRMTAALRAQRAGLAAAREQVLAQEKLATVGRLAAGVAHEIGNPLTAVLGYVEILLADAPEEPPPQDGGAEDPRSVSPSRDLLGRVKSETARIHRIVHDLLEYARPVADGVEPVDLAEVARTAIALARPQPRFRGVTIESALGGAPPVAASSRRLLQVLLNVLLNAADAIAGDGTVTLGIATLDGDRVALDVADTGPGVAQADRERIFDPFFTTKEPGRGTGMGLAVCRSLLQAFGGEIALVPSDKGARFRITLPAWRPTD